MKNIFLFDDDSVLIRHPMLAGVGTLVASIGVTVGVILLLLPVFERFAVVGYLLVLWFFGSILLGFLLLVTGAVNLDYGGRHRIYGAWLLLTGVLVIIPFLIYIGNFGA